MIVYIGVDIAVKRQDIVVLHEDLTIAETVQQPDAPSAAEYIVSQYKEAWVAVDGPRRPNCGLMADKKYRAKLGLVPHAKKYSPYRCCEYELVRRNIQCYCTPPGKARRWNSWMNVGYDLYGNLQKAGFEDFVGQAPLPRRLLIEYFPYASFSVMAGKYLGKKKKPEGRQTRLDLLRQYGVVDDLEHLKVDQIDALVGAVTAHALRHAKACWVGDKDEGLLVVPGKLLETYAR